MLKYITILLDKTSTAYCHADNPYKEYELISVDYLKKAILWAMKENLMIQFVYPDYELPKPYLDLIDSIDHVDIKSQAGADVIVFNGIEAIPEKLVLGKDIVVRLSKEEWFHKYNQIFSLMAKAKHISVVIKDTDKMTESDLQTYSNVLRKMAIEVEKLYVEHTAPQVNILTDRLVLDKMNNCNAGYESITIAPNGKFYLCPAFYYENEQDSLGDITNGLVIKNHNLYKLEYAPICRICDAYQCKRCIWLNRKTTLEVNTPSHQQCVVAHLERNASLVLLYAVRKHGEFLPDQEISVIDYLDPFDKINK